MIVEKEDAYQVNLIYWIEHKWGNEIMVPIYGKNDNKIIDSYLIPRYNAINGLRDVYRPNYNLKPGFDLAGKDGKQYSRFCNYDGIEPLVISQDYEGIYEDNTELVEEFRLLFNLFYDTNEHTYVDPKTMVKVATLKDNEFVYVNIKYLKRYLAVKGMVLVMYLNYQKVIQVDHDHWENISCRNSTATSRYELCIGSCVSGNYTMLNAKKIVYGCPLKECDIWPYDKPPEYIEFIIGVDENGNEKTFTCNPAKLNNMANINPNAPHYLTPIYFESSVLDKYYHEDKFYKVEDGIIRCGNQWSLYIDNNSVENGYVSVYLGDLGRDLPSVEEQHHWRSHNKLIDGKLSLSKFRRDLLVEFAEPDSVDLIFRNEYIRTNSIFEKETGWKLFINLDVNDSYNFNGLRIPTNNSQSQFDMLVLSLVKTLIDSINEKALREQLAKKDVDTSAIKGSIMLLEKWFEMYEFSQFESHIKFLRALQELRSSGTGHRKGRGYKKISNIFELHDNNFSKVFAEILMSSIGFLKYVRENLSPKDGSTNVNK